jgi:hypothetical protein
LKTLVPFFALILSLSTANAQVVLNEVYTDPGAGKQEFFEFYNTSSSLVPENLNGYTLVTYYEESGKVGFYVLDMADVNISAKSFYVGSSQLNFNVQGKTNIIADISWNSLPASAQLTKWEYNGTGYTQVLVPANLNDLFVTRSGSGAGQHIFLFKNGQLINGLIGGTNSKTIPSYIKAMPSLPVDMIAPSPDFTINFSAIGDNQIEYVTPATGSDNGYTRTSDGKCGTWTKSSSTVSHTPGTTNGTATNIAGQLTITATITYSAQTASSRLMYNITAGPAETFPVIVETYRDLGVTSQLDAADILIDSRIINNTTEGAQYVNLANPNEGVMLVAKSVARCYDRVIYVNNFSTLPVKMESFSAMLMNNNRASLKWTTTSEINVSHFILERSIDGVNFTNVAVVFAIGNTTDRTNYSFIDNLSYLQSGIVYYRILSVDIDGKSTFSATRIIRISPEAGPAISILTYPNPVTNELRVGIPENWQNKKVVYELINTSGTVASRTEMANGSQTEIIRTSTLAPGLYFVRVSCDGQNAQQKIVKQ